MSFLTMMNHIVLRLMILLFLNGAVTAQFGDCNYLQELEPGKKFPVFNTNYPQAYPPGTSCRWIATSDRPLNLTCDTINLPSSDKCSQDALIIQDGDGAVGHRYCGAGTLNLLTKSNKLTIILQSTASSSGGKFICSLEMEQDKDEGDNCTCGARHVMSFAHEGVETDVNEYPMVAGLIDTQRRVLVCGATIINKRQVLTAAQCVAGKSTNQIGVLVGDHDLATAGETKATKFHRVEKFHIHPQYNPASLDNDIAIITILGEIEFNEQVSPICLPFDHAGDTFAGYYVEAIGWGSRSSAQQKAKLTVTPNSECKLFAKAHSMKPICTKLVDRDSCKFDNGSPVVWQTSVDRRILGVGITSIGSGCGKDQPAINTRIGAYIDWIESETPKGIEYCKLE